MHMKQEKIYLQILSYYGTTKDSQAAPHKVRAVAIPQVQHYYLSRYAKYNASSFQAHISLPFQYNLRPGTPGYACHVNISHKRVVQPLLHLCESEVVRTQVDSSSDILLHDLKALVCRQIKLIEACVTSRQSVRRRIFVDIALRQPRYTF